MDFHVRPENPGLYTLHFLLGQGSKVIEQAFALGRWSSWGKARPVAPVGVCRKGELRDQQELASRLPQIQVHPIRLVRENSIGQYPLQQAFGLLFGIAALNSDECEDAMGYFSRQIFINNHGGFGYSL